jgi:hypothetical protein
LSLVFQIDFLRELITTMSSFWDAEDKIPVKQTRVAIQAEHGLDYVSGQKITINVPATVQYFQPKESYLKFEVLLNQGGGAYVPAVHPGKATGLPTRLQLDPHCGAQVLIKHIRISSGGSGAQLLEEYQDYNVLTALKYDYENDETLRSKRSLTEGCTDWDQTTRGTMGTTKSVGANLAHNPYFAPYTVGANPDSSVTAGDAPWGNATSTPAGSSAFNGGNKKVKCLLPLHTGIFQNDKVFPSLLTEGLRIEIELESAGRVVKMLDSARMLTKRRLAPIFHSAAVAARGPSEGGSEQGVIDGAGNACSEAGAGGIQALIKYFYVHRKCNNQLNTDNFPFVCGEQFTFVNTLRDPKNNAGEYASIPLTTAGGNQGQMVIESIRPVAGQGNLTGIGGWWGLIEIGVVGTGVRIPAAIAGHADFVQLSGNGDCDWAMVSLSAVADSQYVPQYTLSNTELILQQLEMPAGYTRKMMSMMKEGGTLNYDFLSSTNYKYSQLKGDIVANIRLPLSQSRAKSILSVPTDATAYSSRALLTGDNHAVPNFTELTEDVTAAPVPGGAKYDTIYSADDYTYLEKPAHILGGDAAAVVVNLPNQPAIPYGTHNTPDGACYSDRSGYTGIWDNCSNYQWFYNGQLNPNRKVDVSKTSTQQSISQQQLVELEKALAMAGIRPLSFKMFNKNACIGRALSLQDGVYDTRGRDFNLQVNYEKTEAPNKNKLWCNFVHHIRRLVIKGNMISLEI